MAINERVGILTHVPGQDKPNPGLIGGIYGDYLTKELDFLDDSRNQPLASDFTSSAAYWMGFSTDPNAGGDWEDLGYRYRVWRDSYFHVYEEHWLSRSIRNELSFESIAFDPKPWTNQWNGSNQYEWIRRVSPSTVDGSFNYPYPEFPVAGDHYAFYNNRRPLYHHYQRHNLGSLSDMATSALYQTGGSWLIDQNTPVSTNVDPAYNFGSGFQIRNNDFTYNLLRAVKRLPNGKILVAGAITEFNGSPVKEGNRVPVIRLNIDGTLDTSFNLVNLAGAGVFCMDIDSNGKILLGGRDILQIDPNRSYEPVIRLNSDGTLDDTFLAPEGSVGFGAPNQLNINSIKSLPDGKVLVGGLFNDYDPTTPGDPWVEVRRCLVRLNSDGSMDETFVSFGANIHSDYYANESGGYLVNTPIIYDIYLYEDGKILVSGVFTEVSFDGNQTSITANGILRLNSDGTLDTSFDTGLGFSTVNPASGQITIIKTVFADSTGKIYVAGDFDMFNGVDIQSNFVKLNSDGSLDQVFPKLIGADYQVPSTGWEFLRPGLKIKPIANNKILVIGWFDYYGSTDVSNSIMVINNDGTLDTGFDFGQGLDASLYSTDAEKYNIVRDAEMIGDTLIVVGKFTKYYDPNMNVNRIVAIKNAPIEHTASFLAEEYRSNRERMFYLLNEKGFRNLTTEEETELASRRAEFLATDHTKLQYSLWSGDKAKQIWSYYFNNGWAQRYAQDTPNSGNIDTLDIWPADTTISEALGVTGSVTYNRLPAVQSVSFLPTTGNPGDVIRVHDFDDMAWDPIRGMWSSALYNRFFEIIFQSIRSQFSAKMQSSNGLSLAMRPVLFACLYIPAFQLTTDGNINSELKTF